ncbi:MAG: MFS transporter, partial [Dehalococcoidia bacterium]
QPPTESGHRQLPSWLRTFQSLTIPAYRNYSIALLLYYGAMQAMMLARPLLAYELSADETGQRSALALGLTVASYNLPSLVVSPWAGALADRLNKRHIVQVCAGIMGILALALGFGVVTGVFEWWHVAIIGALQGALMMAVTPARRTLIADLVDSRYLLNAVALSVVNQNINRAITPAAAGFIIAAFGAQWAMWLIGGLYFAAMLAMFSVPLVRTERLANRGSMLRSIGDGFLYAKREPIIRNLLIIGIIGSVFGQPIQQLLPLFQEVLDVGPAEIGLLTTFMGIGSLMGATTAASLSDFKRKGLLLIGFFSLLGIAIIAFSSSSIFALSLFLMIPIGMGNSGRNTVHSATIQAYSDPSMRGRVVALTNMESGVAPVAILGVTALAEVLGAQLAVGTLGVLIVVYALWEVVVSKTVRNL